MSTFEKLVAFRKQSSDITQRKMAKILKCTPSSLNKYEQGIRKISAEKQDEYAEAMGIDLKLMIKDVYEVHVFKK